MPLSHLRRWLSGIRKLLKTALLTKGRALEALDHRKRPGGHDGSDVARRGGGTGADLGRAGRAGGPGFGGGAGRSGGPGGVGVRGGTLV